MRIFRKGNIEEGSTLTRVATGIDVIEREDMCFGKCLSLLQIAASKDRLDFRETASSPIPPLKADVCK